MSGESIVNSAKTPERDLGWSRQFGLEAERTARDGLRGKGGRRRQERPRRRGLWALTGELQAKEGRPLCRREELVQGVVHLTLA